MRSTWRLRRGEVNRSGRFHVKCKGAVSDDDAGRALLERMRSGSAGPVPQRPPWVQPCTSEATHFDEMAQAWLCDLHWQTNEVVRAEYSDFLAEFIVFISLYHDDDELDNREVRMAQMQARLDAWNAAEMRE